MLEQVSNFEQDIKFIMGFAGSGKSTRLAKLADSKTLVLTPTHKAAGVLKGKGVENVYTIHSVLKLAPTLNQNYKPGKHRMQSLKKVGDTDLKEITDVFIDEFSMINQEILDLLLEVLPDSCKVTIFGDPQQLPPVDGEPIEPEVYTTDIEYLTTQHRADAPAVVETFMRFVSFIDGSGEMNLKLNKAIQHGTLDGFNPETDRALAFTNAKVSDMNSIIASNLGLDADYRAGEPLYANQVACTLSDELSFQSLYPKCISKGKLMEPEDLRKQAQKVDNDIMKYGTDLSSYQSVTIEVDEASYNIVYSTNHYKEEQELKANIDKWQSYVYANNHLPEDEKLTTFCKNNRGAPGVKERGRAWSRYIAHTNLVFNLQRPFATTIHKAQGQEFGTVYIAQDDIKKSIYNGYYMNYARLMYVALSRAINKVVIV